VEMETEEESYLKKLRRKFLNHDQVKTLKFVEMEMEKESY
jgi:hypothetical protein